MIGDKIAESSTKSPLVTVIINCYNGAQYLREAIDSIYAQTYDNWEIVFWDNASTDNSGEIAQSYDSRIRYFRGEENILLGAARNKAMRQAKGEFIGFLDCDDVWLTDKLEKQICLMCKGNYGLCYGSVLNINSAGKKIGTSIVTHRKGNIFEKLLYQFDVNLPTALVRASALQNSNLAFDGKITGSEEYCLFMQLAVGHDFYSMPDILAKYRIHDGALTNKSISKWAEEREYTLNVICKQYPGIRDMYQEAFKEAYARAAYYRARNFMFLKNRYQAVREMASIALLSTRYFILFILTLFPISAWNFIHRQKTKRNI